MHVSVRLFALRLNSISGRLVTCTALNVVVLLNYSPSAATSAQIAKTLILPIFVDEGQNRN